MNENDFLDMLNRYGQHHIADHFRSISERKRSQLLAHTVGLDFDLVYRLHKEWSTKRDASLPSRDVRQARIIPLPRSAEDFNHRERARQAGVSLLQEGKVAVLIVAGGQGVRLGHDKPKGTFPISPVMKKTLFQLFAEQVKATSQRHGTSLPLLIMTSQENHDETITFFEAHHYFGLEKKQVFFFQQGVLPTVTPEGHLLLKDETHLLTNPDGHGGSLKALHTSGLLKEMTDRGVTEIFYCQVDNPLVRIADPVFLGYHLLTKAECSTKVVRRTNREEKVGVYVAVEGRDRILEYSDFGGRHMEAVDENGEILFWAGNTAIHVLNLAFVRRLNDGGFILPYHCARKVVESFTPKGTRVQGEAWKFETFVFDAIPLAEKTCCMEIDRAEEFAPVKNRKGPDSPETSRRAMNNLFKRWLAAAGVTIANRALVEISPLFALDQEELLTKLQGRSLSISGDTYLG